MTPALTPQQAIAALWRAGDLSYRLLDHQEPIRDAIIAARARRFVLNCSRRLGKSNLLCTLAIEQCLQKPGSQVRYAAGTSDMVEEIIEPHMASLIDDAPADVTPQFNASKSRWTFPNGSSIRVAGCDDRRKANRLRGRACDLAIIDEAGFIDDLDYVIQDVLMPQLMTVNGQIIISSTPPETPAHPFRAICADAQLRGAYIERDIYAATHITNATREEFRQEANGAEWKPGMPDGTTWLREYMCQFVTDTARAVLPEFSAVEKAIVEERERPAYYVPVIVADVGFHDFTFVVGGYYDFAKGVDVIEWEYVTNKTRARDIVAAVDALAVEHWGEKAATGAMRHADAPPMQIAEMPGWQGIAKTQTDGNWKTAVVNDVRQRLAEKSTRIHPRCEKLIAHCRYAVWKDPGRMLERMDGFGHFDGVDALAYFTRLVDRHSNPFPRRAPGVTSADHWLEPSPNVDLERALAGRWQQPRTGARR